MEELIWHIEHEAKWLVGFILAIFFTLSLTIIFVWFMYDNDFSNHVNELTLGIAKCAGAFVLACLAYLICVQLLTKAHEKKPAPPPGEGGHHP